MAYHEPLQPLSSFLPLLPHPPIDLLFFFRTALTLTLTWQVASADVGGGAITVERGSTSGAGGAR